MTEVVEESAPVEVLAQAWRDLDRLCSNLDDRDWHVATELPEWSVKDVIAHIAGSESMFLGRPPPQHTPASTEHVKNAIGGANEVEVDYRRAWPPERVLEEFREVTGERLGVLRALSDEELAAESWVPVGRGTVADLVGFRVLDAWTHEQDIRSAVGRRGGLDTAAAHLSYARLRAGMPYVVGKKVGAPDDSLVAFRVEGATPEHTLIEVRSGRAEFVEGTSKEREPTTTLTMDLETFCRLACGRTSAAAELEAGRVIIAGDRDLGERVLSEMTVMI